MNDWIAEHNHRADIYFGPNPLKKSLNKKATKDDIAEARWLWADIDPPKDDNGKDLTGDALAEWQSSIDLRALPPGIPGPPTVTVLSGRGFWLFWRLRTPQPVDGVGGPLTARVESYAAGVEVAYGADDCRNIDRIARLPDTVNRKTNVYGFVLDAHWDCAYEIEQFPLITKEKSQPVDGGETDSSINEDELKKIESALSVISNDNAVEYDSLVRHSMRLQMGRRKG